MKVRKLTTLQISHGITHVTEASNGFKNYSGTIFSEGQEMILTRGPKYAPHMKITEQDYTVFSARLDQVLKNLPECVNRSDVSAFSSNMKRIMNNLRQERPNNNDFKIIRELRKMDVVFSASDKSKKFIAMDVQQCQSLLNDQKENLVPTKVILPVTVQNKFNSKLSKLARKYAGKPIGNNLRKLTCSEPLPSHMRVLPEDHKEGILRGRPIVAAPPNYQSSWPKS